jgi:hypothetical protein
VVGSDGAEVVEGEESGTASACAIAFDGSVCVNSAGSLAGLGGTTESGATDGGISGGCVDRSAPIREWKVSANPNAVVNNASRCRGLFFFKVIIFMERRFVVLSRDFN